MLGLSPEIRRLSSFLAMKLDKRMIAGVLRKSFINNALYDKAAGGGIAKMKKVGKKCGSAFRVTAPSSIKLGMRAAGGFSEGYCSAGFNFVLR
jgi:hypothetical protein